MNGTHSKIRKTLDLILFIRYAGKFTIDEVAELLGVSERSAFRYISGLEYAGFEFSKPKKDKFKYLITDPLKP